jgi:hypothetical protein
MSVGHSESTPVTFSIVVYSMKEMTQHYWELAVDFALLASYEFTDLVS